MKYATFEELEDKYIGNIGTPRRDAYEQALKEEIHSYNIGEAIKQARIKQELTQEQLGERMGVQRAQVSRIESGRNLTFATVARAFKALGIPAELSAGDIKLALW
ncbi:MAG: helix-turn-helix domain-containing protein [Bacteroides sp.]|nr:helix-turn-helix domain-containing protein [Bacteroides sp.]MCM1457843.1 helix-turn-helix domain-containing protein [Lachnoclostridium sp.]